jgi:poly-gamma-glutamate capsule biosynthesis protein CapA/YwtB (metallophosphatase superfamily)
VIQIGWVGDLTPGSKYGQPPGDGRALFETTREQLQRPDLMIANLEGTFGSGGASKCDDSDSGDCYAFQAPPENAESLAWAGIDAVNLANNHSNDYFSAGLESTTAALEEHEITYTGLGDEYVIHDADGVSVALIGFSPYPWSPNIGDLGEVRRLVTQASSEASIVVVLMHAGAEGADKTRTPEGDEHAYGEFRGNVRAFSHAAIDAGADMVLGSGPHVVRGMELYEGKPIAYSLGNFAGWKNFNRSGDLALSGLLTIEVDENGEVLEGRWISLRIADPGVPRIDWNGESAKLVNELSAEDFEQPIVLDAEGSFTLDTPEEAATP